MYVVIQGATHAQSSPDSASTWIFKLIIVLLLMTAMYPGSIGKPYNTLDQGHWLGCLHVEIHVTAIPWHTKLTAANCTCRYM